MSVYKKAAEGKFDEIEQKTALKEVKAEPPKLETEAAPLVIKSEVDAYIHEAMKSQPMSLQDIETRDIKADDGRHRLALPDEVEKVFKKRGYTGRWINKDKRMIDRALFIRKWVIVNRVIFPELPKRLFTANGTIENGDSILGCMPEKQAAILRSEPGTRSTERVKSLPIEKWKDGGESYYKPTLVEEKDGETVSSGVDPETFKQT